jgi:hypothetical protein
MRGIFTKCFVLGFMIPLGSWAANRKSPDVAAEQTTRIFVLVLNTAAVPESTLSEAKKQAGSVLKNVGVEVEWIDCQLATNDSVCTGTAEANQLQLTIVTEDNRQMFGEGVFGRSVVGGSNRGVYARVFYAHIQAKAEQEGASPATLLGLAMVRVRAPAAWP